MTGQELQRAVVTVLAEQRLKPFVVAKNSGNFPKLEHPIRSTPSIENHGKDRTSNMISALVQPQSVKKEFEEQNQSVNEIKKEFVSQPPLKEEFVETNLAGKENIIKDKPNISCAVKTESAEIISSIDAIKKEFVSQLPMKEEFVESKLVEDTKIRTVKEEFLHQPHIKEEFVEPLLFESVPIKSSTEKENVVALETTKRNESSKHDMTAKGIEEYAFRKLRNLGNPTKEEALNSSAIIAEEVQDFLKDLQIVKNELDEELHVTESMEQNIKEATFIIPEEVTSSAVAANSNTLEDTWRLSKQNRKQNFEPDSEEEFAQKPSVSEDYVELAISRNQSSHEKGFIATAKSDRISKESPEKSLRLPEVKKNVPRPYICQVCDKSFSRSINLTRHEAIHKGIKSFSCEDCNKSFAIKSTLDTHRRTHRTYEERPFKCTVCGNQFNQANGLTAHMKSHTAEKPYNCELCPETFRHPSSQAQHVRQVHQKYSETEVIPATIPLPEVKRRVSKPNRKQMFESDSEEETVLGSNESSKPAKLFETCRKVINTRAIMTANKPNFPIKKKTL